LLGNIKKTYGSTALKDLRESCAAAAANGDSEKACDSFENAVTLWR
jgi:hypothetical protein